MLVAHHLRAPAGGAERPGRCAARWCWCRWPTRSVWRSGWTTRPWGVLSWTARRTSTATTRFGMCGVRWSSDKLGTDAAGQRALMRETCGPSGAMEPATELQSLRKTLVLLSFDADIVLDLHCDCEAVLHLYTENPAGPNRTAGPPAGCAPVLLAKNSGGVSFDECLSGLVAAGRQSWRGIARRSGPAATGLRQHHGRTAWRSRCRHALATTLMRIHGYLQHAGLDAQQATRRSVRQSACGHTAGGRRKPSRPGPGVLVFAAAAGRLPEKSGTWWPKSSTRLRNTACTRAPKSRRDVCPHRDRYVTAPRRPGQHRRQHSAYRTGTCLAPENRIIRTHIMTAHDRPHAQAAGPRHPQALRRQ
jgi:hypothetical protein